MKLYQVQLEFSDTIYSYEVFTNDLNAVEMAREHLSGLIGEQEAKVAHHGGGGEIGRDPDRTEVLVILERVTGPGGFP
jgi:hypothetical protein